MLAALPDRPLTLAETTVLDRRDDVDLCRPVVGLRDAEPPDVVAVYLGLGTGVHLLGYETDSGGWERLDSFSTADPPALFEAATDRVLEWATTYYGGGRIAVLSTAPAGDVHAVLPDRPLDPREVRRLAGLVGVEAAHAVFCLAESHAVVALLVATEDRDDQRGVWFHALGFDATAAGWTVVGDDRVGPDDEPDPALSETLFDWVLARYDERSLLAIAPPET